ncbi:MAG TPA: DUF1801 domain-containing protein [Fimbriimonas sp.]|nr:DUF1801 domain-containing protein [Fimbriimonas sp.]
MNVEEFLAGLAEDRRESIGVVRQVVVENMPDGLAESLTNGMINYVVPLSVYPPGYHTTKGPLPFAAIASQKNYMVLHLVNVYMNPELDEWFRAEYAKSGKKLDMGKGCLRFKKASDLALDVVAELFKRQTVDEYIENYKAQIASRYAKP